MKPVSAFAMLASEAIRCDLASDCKFSRELMARKNRDEVASWHVEQEPTLCAICERVIPDDQKEDHHLVPKSKGGKIIIPLHSVCHRQIHAIFTESQLAKKFSTTAALLEDPAMQKFVGWIKNKPPGFSDAAKDSREISGRNRKP
jgi:hypothetical protein